MRKFNALILFSLILFFTLIVFPFTTTGDTLTKSLPTQSYNSQKSLTPISTVTSIISQKVQSKATTTIKISPKITTRTQAVKSATVQPAPVVKVHYLDTIMSGVYNQYPHLNNSFANYVITNPGKLQSLVTIESEILGYSEKSINTVKIQPGGKIEINDTPLLNISKLPKEISTASFHYRVTGEDGKVIEEKTIPVEIYPKDTMVWSVTEGNEVIDESAFIAAWITPHSRAIDKLLRDSANRHPDYNIEGYQCDYCTNDDEWEEYTNAQVEAIYDTLATDYNITYVDSSIAFGRNEDDIQRVRLPEESLASNSINCIDGTVLFASALEAAGIDPAIVLTPDHAFVGWWISPDSDALVFLETTMVGDSTFNDALDEGSYEYDDEEANGNFESNASAFIDVYELREMGIRPME